MDAHDELGAVDDDSWAELLEDARALAAEYEEGGWEATTLRPTRVAVHLGEEEGDGDGAAAGVDGRGRGIEVVVPAEELDGPYGRVADRELRFDGSEVYAAREDDLVLLVVVLVASEAELALAIPMAYGPRGERLLDAIEGAAGAGADDGDAESGTATGELRTVVRDEEGRSLLFAHDDPSIFRPA